MNDSLKQFPEEVEGKLDESLNELLSQLQADGGYYPILKGRREVENNFYNLVRVNITNPVVDKYLIDYILGFEEVLKSPKDSLERKDPNAAKEFVCVIFTEKIIPILNAEIIKLASDSERKELRERVYKIVDAVGGIKGFDNEYTFDYAYSLEGTQDDKILRLENSYLKLAFFYSDDYKNPNKHDIASPANFKVQQLWADFRRNIKASINFIPSYTIEADLTKTHEEHMAKLNKSVDKIDLLVISLMNVIRESDESPTPMQMVIDNLYGEIKPIYHDKLSASRDRLNKAPNKLNLKKRFAAIEKRLGIKIEG
jgi:hypothetical protein